MKNLLIIALALMVPTIEAVAQNKGSLNDAQIIAILIAANEVDIHAAELAESKTTNEQVKAFANTMISEHTDVNRQVIELAKKLNITPEENKFSKSVKQDRQKNLTRLKKLSGKRFDKGYVYQEIVLHKQVIDVINHKLMPNARNDELKALLTKIKPALVSHLAEAERLEVNVDQMHYPK
jgi:putative membrane protein